MRPFPFSKHHRLCTAVFSAPWHQERESTNRIEVLVLNIPVASPSKTVKKQYHRCAAASSHGNISAGLSQQKQEGLGGLWVLFEPCLKAQRDLFVSHNLLV